MTTPLPRFQFKVTLDGTDPPVWRRILVPRNATLRRLSDVIQVSMGWTGIHMHRFKQDGREIGTMRPSVPIYLEDDSQFAITHLCFRPGDEVAYEYDFVSRWEHAILLERIVPGDEAPPGVRCLDGERACPPEHCKGVAHFQSLLQTVWNPSGRGSQLLSNWSAIDFEPGRFDLGAVNEALAKRSPRGMARAAVCSTEPHAHERIRRGK